MGRQVSKQELVKQAIKLASETRQEIDQAGLNITNYEQIADLFNLSVTWGELSLAQDGLYMQNKRKIVLNSNVSNIERNNFTFCHELMHARIEDNYLGFRELLHGLNLAWQDIIEWLCNAGASELLMPSDQIRKMEFSVTLIPELCEQFNASSIAVALQMVNCAAHKCLLTIAELRQVLVEERPLLGNSQDKFVERLVVTYWAKSASVAYMVKKNFVFLLDHPLYSVLNSAEMLKCEAMVPIGRMWPCDCEAIYFRGKIFAFFNLTSPPNINQPRLL